jgi:hypothetical protein
VAWSTYQAIFGQRIAPWFADRYLAKNAVEGQETSDPIAPDRPDNLFQTVPGNEYAAHGIFDNMAGTWTSTGILQRHSGSLLTGLGLLSAGCVLLGVLSRKK